jgi:ribonuclease G
MYEVDDAVAKIDGYIISVVNGGRYVGTKKLVRIEEAGRTAAVATLLDADDPDQTEEDGGDADSLESKPRRRGRRGGRRRSAAKAEATSE